MRRSALHSILAALEQSTNRRRPSLIMQLRSEQFFDRPAKASGPVWQAFVQRRGLNRQVAGPGRSWTARCSGSRWFHAECNSCPRLNTYRKPGGTSLLPPKYSAAQVGQKCLAPGVKPASSIPFVRSNISLPSLSPYTGSA